MLEELTPQILSVALFFVIAVAPVLTLIVSALILWLYRRSVLRAMAAMRGSEASNAGEGDPRNATVKAEPRDEREPRPEARTATSGKRRYQLILRLSWQAAARCGGA